MANGLFGMTPQQIRQAEAAQRVQDPLQTLAGNLFNLGNAGGNALRRGLFGQETRSPAELQAIEMQALTQGINPADRNSMLAGVKRLADAGFQAQALELSKQIPEAKSKPSKKFQLVEVMKDGSTRQILTRDVEEGETLPPIPQSGRDLRWLGIGTTPGASPTTNVNVPVSIGAKGHSEFAFTKFGEVNKVADSARGMLNGLRFAKQQLAGLETGALTDWTKFLGQVGASLGVPIPEKISNLESADSVFGRMVMGGLEAFPGSISDSERKFVASKFPALAQTSEGRGEIMRYMENIAQREIDREQMMEPYMQRETPTLFPKGEMSYAAKVDQYDKFFPVFGRQAQDANGRVIHLGTDGKWRFKNGTLVK